MDVFWSEVFLKQQPPYANVPIITSSYEKMMMITWKWRHESSVAEFTISKTMLIRSGKFSRTANYPDDEYRNIGDELQWRWQRIIIYFSGGKRHATAKIIQHGTEIFVQCFGESIVLYPCACDLNCIFMCCYFPSNQTSHCIAFNYWNVG